MNHDYKVTVGDPVPRFKARDCQGKEYTDKDLKGSTAVIYFYPKDQTSGCTTQACSFRDNMPKFEELKVKILGISPDGPHSHEEFIKKQHLNFTLLSDENHEICQAFDVLYEKNKDGKMVKSIERSTFLVGPDGIIEWIERPVQVEGHVHRVLEAIKMNKL